MPSDHGNGQGKAVAWVLGAGREPGRGLALTLARRGYRVALHDFNPAGLEATAQTLRRADYEVLPLSGELVRKITLQGLFNQIEDTWGRLDVIVYADEANPQADLLRLDEWDWHRALDMNLTVPWLLAQQAGRVMLQGGAVFFVGGDAPLRDAAANPGLPLLAGRGGLLASLATWAEMLRPRRVWVNVLLPTAPRRSPWREMAIFADQAWPDDPPRDLGELLFRALNDARTGQILALASRKE
ncbi:MAG: SDR family oxidoreductase [Chloroflexi bacterium]|nr:SDR family oxidoreductase [Chloroflexota bacterium]